MSTPVIYFLSDPFEGDINPGTADGAKLFATATKDRTKEDLLMISQSKVADIMSSFRHDSNMFCWGKLINMIKDITREEMFASSKTLLCVLSSW